MHKNTHISFLNKWGYSEAVVAGALYVLWIKLVKLMLLSANTEVFLSAINLWIIALQVTTL